jgi:hypothetical protein
VKDLAIVLDDQRLKQEVPGQLGLLARRMAEAGANIEALYSDHDHHPGGGRHRRGGRGVSRVERGESFFGVTLRIS